MPSLATTEPCPWDSVRDPQFQSIDCWIFYSHNFHRSKLGMPMPAYSTQNDPKSTWVCPKKNCVCTKKKFRWYPQQPRRFIFTKSFWSVLRSQALKTPQLNLLWNLLGNPVKPDLALHQIPHLLRNLLRNPLNLTWPCTKASWNLLQKLLRNPVGPDLAPRQSLPSPEPSPEPCWTWLCTKASRNLVEPDPISLRCWGIW